MKGHSLLQERLLSEILIRTFWTRKEAQCLAFYLGIEHMTSHLQYDVAMWQIRQMHFAEFMYVTKSESISGITWTFGTLKAKRLESQRYMYTASNLKINFTTMTLLAITGYLCHK